jgi:hypothetical protein
MPMLALEIVFYANGPSIFIVVLLLFFLSTLILVTTITLWLQGPRSAWKLGIKDLQGPLPGRMGVSILGRKRSTNDNARSAWKEVIILLKTIIYRRIEYVVSLMPGCCYLTLHSRDVESARYAVTRNTMAIILLTVLVAQSVILLGGVFAENYAAREVWRLPSQFYPADFCRLSIFYVNSLGIFLRLVSYGILAGESSKSNVECSCIVWFFHQR